ncbi:MAG TPA: hypothetical protein VGR22_07635 [Thermomicrobiales bacterium]|nr:hypothetical protein [Thermomicrobiales bacterium]
MDPERRAVSTSSVLGGTVAGSPLHRIAVEHGLLLYSVRAVESGMTSDELAQPFVC